MGRRYNTHKRYNKNRSYKPRYPRKYGGKKIPTDKYIAKAEEGYIAPSIYVEDKTYDDFNISNATLKQNITRKGYKNPTKIQHQAIPLILQGKDILGLASTGSGKTAAFLIPLIDRALKDRSQKCLIIVPTRELAAQIQDEFRILAQGTNIYSTLVIGGTRINKQINQLRRNPEFVMGTPGRLKDLFERGVLDLGKFNNIVLDEVDRMLDMGFIPDITFLISKLRDKKQTLFFSATMTKEAERIGNTLLNNPIRIQVEKESALKSVNQDIVRVKNPADKVKTLETLLDKDEFKKVLIFSRTKRGADKLSKQLFERGFRADAIHGDKSQNKRLAVMKKFKMDQLDVLVATDVAARGIDIPNVSHVINYDEPENYKDYIHRIGRTGRAGKTGCALTFVR
ncbi:DEAD/DEAH box helicase [bacterium]|nr:DEAD/DEAH box helicase [bacterium]